MSKKVHQSSRQLFILGCLSIMIAPLVALITVKVYGLPWPHSISETGTIANQVSPILPLILGGLGLFGLTYKSKYTKADTACAVVMGIGFILVAIQMCASDYVTVNKVGVLGLSKEASNIVHSVGALVGFGAMLVWQLFFFTKTANRDLMTKQKKIRNICYYINSALTLTGITIFILGSLGVFKEEFCHVYWAEALILTFAGLSCIIKSGVTPLFRDK